MDTTNKPGFTEVEVEEDRWWLLVDDVVDNVDDVDDNDEDGDDDEGIED